MNIGSYPGVPKGKVVVSAAFFLMVAGCQGVPDVDASSDPLVVSESDRTAVTESEARTAAVSEMRARSAASEQSSGYPQVFQAERTARLAARSEPRPVAEVEAIEAELAALSLGRNRASPGEIAALQARADELRRLAAARAASAPRP